MTMIYNVDRVAKERITQLTRKPGGYTLKDIQEEDRRRAYKKIVKRMKAPDVIYVKRQDCYADDWEGEWDRTVRRREENHPLMRGMKNGTNY